MDTHQRTGLDRLCWFLARFRLKILIVILVISGIFIWGAFQIRGEVILSEMLPFNHPYLKLHARFSEVFGSGGSGVIIALKAKKGDIFEVGFLTKLQKMTNEVELWDEVFRVLTVSIASHSVKVVKAMKKGEIAIEPLMWPEVPKNALDMALLKGNIFSNRAYNGVLVSKDGTAALLFTEFKENISYEHAFGLLQKLRKDYSDGETSVHIVGFPMLMGWIYSLKTQIFNVFLLSIIGMIVVLVIIFYGNFLGMIVVMGSTLICTVWGLGFTGFTRINFSPMVYVLAFLVGARMVGNAHQITYRYFEELHSSGNDRLKASYETMRSMFMPNASAVAADVAGFGVLIIAKIVLMQHIAIIMSFWMITILLTGFLVPAIASLIPLKVASEKWAKESCHVDWLAKFLMGITRFAIGPRSRYVVWAIILIFGSFCFWQAGKLKIGDPTPGSPVLWPSHPYNQDQVLINQLFKSSSENFMLFYEGKRESVYDPATMITFDGFDRYMKERLPDIYKSSSSIINMVKMLNVTFHDGDLLWQELPGNQTMLTGLMGYIRQNTDKGTLGRFIDLDLERTQLTVYFSDHTSNNLLRIRDAAYDFFKKWPMKLENGEYRMAGGRIGMEIALNEEMKRTHMLIDLAVYATIFVVCAISFMSITAGLMLTLPLILANSVAAGYMSLSNIGLSINTLPVAAIGAGVGVDFAIYLYARSREEFALMSGDWNEVIIQSMCTCGKAVIYTGLTIIVPIITWYFFSDMKFQAQVGFYLSMIMGTNVILTLVFHPMVIYFKPKFISKGRPSPADKAVEAGKAV